MGACGVSLMAAPDGYDLSQKPHVPLKRSLFKLTKYVGRAAEVAEKLEHYHERKDAYLLAKKWLERDKDHLMVVRRELNKNMARVVRALEPHYGEEE